MALLISNAILHIINNGGSEPLLSDVELEVDSETCYGFISKHVRRLINAPAAREATFRAESTVYSLVKSYQKEEIRFKEFSRRLAERLNTVIQANEDIPSGDLIICSFDQGKKSYIAIVKLPYSECITHRILSEENTTETQLVKHLTVLPTTTGKVTEACLIPYDPMIIRVLEQPAMMNGEMVNYFSHLFLECDTEISRKETADLIKEIAEEVNTLYFDGSIDTDTRIKQSLVEQAPEDEEEGLNLETAAKRAFGDNEDAVKQFVERVKEVGLPHEVKLNKSYVHRQFKTQRIKADNGIEIKLPLELSQDPEQVQIVTNQDGSLSVTLKNLRSTS